MRTEIDRHVVVVEFDDEKVTLEELIDALNEAGYTVGEPREVDYPHSGRRRPLVWSPESPCRARRVSPGSRPRPPPGPHPGIPPAHTTRSAPRPAITRGAGS